ncbi:O-unit flippase [Fischerella thermalis CCMEE 5198]|jgi:PST family polysaccharide transporter|uniref:flippase n=1 Tax=Fischerella thermalis TaxID=372787 RepID=UPI000C80D6DC|nr:flippase [Fischerella thermalis]PMB07717.1 O-unit flippase [Fischerella thermalis CCMEE 5196]PMB22449.1 O-unit flippase [Fischerella thermalis CCMEE 5198]
MPGKFKIPQLSLFKSHSELRAVIANTGWLFVDRILRMGAGLVVGVWVARYLGAKQFGLLNYATAFITLFGPIASLGLDNIVVRHLVHDALSKKEILGTAFRLKLLGGIISLLLPISIILLLLQNDTLTVELVAILGVISIFQAFDTIDLWFQSQVQSKYTVLAKNTAFFLVTLARVILIWMQAPLVAFAWAIVAEYMLGAVGLAIVYRIKGYSFWSWGWSYKLARDLLKESWPLIFSGFAILIYMKIDQIMLGTMMDDQAVGIYSAAVRVSEIWYFIPMAITSSVSPSIFAAKKTSELLYYQRLKKLLRLMALISVVLALPISFLSETIIMMLFGNDYVIAGPILAIHIWASLFVFLGVGADPWFIAESLTDLSLYRTVIGAVINVLLNLLLIPSYGGVGAAIATVIAYACGSVFANATHRKTWKVFKLQMLSLLIFN